MSSNNFSTSAPNSRAPVLPPTLVSLADPPLLGGDEPLIFDELTGPYAMRPNDWYEWEDPMPTVTSIPGLQASPELWVPVDAVSIAPRQRHRAPAPTRQETEARHPELPNKPETKRRKAPPVKGVSGRVIEKKVEQACMRCRAAKQKCDGEKPHCRRCTRRNRRCSYVPTERQIEWAQKKAAGSANTPPESVEQPRTVAITPPENYVLTAPGRRLLPRPEAPIAAMGGFTAGAEAQLQDPEYFDRALEDLNTMPIGYSQYPQQPGWTSGELDFWSTGVLQYPPQPNLAFRGYLSQPSRPLPFLGEPSLTSEGSVGQSTGFSLYTRDPSMASDGPTAFSENSTHQNEPGMGFMNYEYPQTSPEDGQDLTGSNHFDEQAWALAHFAGLDAMDLPGNRRT